MRNQRGITLIALVITIIVLLILAGVSIAMLTGDNGILTKAQDSVATTNISEDKEAAAMDLNAAYTAYMEAKYVDNDDVDSFTDFLTENSTTYLKDTAHYKYEGGKITTVSVNEEGKKEEATVQANGGLSAWTPIAGATE